MDGSNNGDMFSWMHQHQTEIVLAATTGLIAAYGLQKHRSSQQIVASVTAQCKESIPPTSTIVVTGANTGIGFAAANILAETGAEIILACRDESRAKDAMRRIQQTTGNQNIKVELLDLSDIASIERFAGRIKKCHILVNNAGIMQAKQQFLYDKYDQIVMTNYIGPWYLTNLLLPKMIATSLEDKCETKIVNVGSRLEKHSPLRSMYEQQGRTVIPSILQDSDGTYFSKAYATSKLGNMLNTAELHKRINSNQLQDNNVPQARVSVNAVTPGMVNTDLARFLPWYVQYASYPVRALFLKSSDLGGAEVAHVAALKGSSGKYYGERQLLADLTTDAAYDKELAKNLWEETENQLKDIKAIVNESKKSK